MSVRKAGHPSVFITREVMGIEWETYGSDRHVPEDMGLKLTVVICTINDPIPNQTFHHAAQSRSEKTKLM